LLGVSFFCLLQVEVRFMYVGHTHNQNDQIHGRLAVALRHFQALTLSDLMRLVKSAYTPNFDPNARTVISYDPNVEVLEEVADWRRFLDSMAQKESTAGSFFIQGWRFSLDEAKNIRVDLKYRHELIWTCGHTPYKQLCLYDWSEPLCLQPVSAMAEFLGPNPAGREESVVKKDAEMFANGLMGRLRHMSNNGSFTEVRAANVQLGALSLLAMRCLADV
jgi:hypothetical protein